MKLMRLAAVVAAFAVVGGTVMAEDADVRALQAKLAAQEARLNDLQAKMYSGSGDACEPEIIAQGLTSLRKNAVVTIGGVVNTRYHSRNSKLESDLTFVAGPSAYAYDPAGKQTISKGSYGQLHVSDALLQVSVDVNEYFDAYAQFNFNDQAKGADSAGMAEAYWIRWKNVCNTGFGLLVGRDREKHGGINGPSIYDNWQVGESDSAGGAFAGWGEVDAANLAAPTNLAEMIAVDFGEGMFNGSTMIPTHSTHGTGRVVQVNPYWESQDGRFKAELSLFQTTEYEYGKAYFNDASGVRHGRTVNFGFGSTSFRLTAQPIEGLKLVASVKNLNAQNYNNGVWKFHEATGFYGEDLEDYIAKNNTSVFAGFEYTPTFFNRATLWASYMHGWNEAWVKDQDSDSVSFGLNFKITDNFMAFGAGDWLRVKNAKAGQTWYKADGWASDIGLQYTLPYGVTAQAGWRHEFMKYSDRAGHEHTKYTADTIYGHLGFAF